MPTLHHHNSGIVQCCGDSGSLPCRVLQEIKWAKCQKKWQKRAFSTQVPCSRLTCVNNTALCVHHNCRSCWIFKDHPLLRSRRAGKCTERPAGMTRELLVIFLLSFQCTFCSWDQRLCKNCSVVMYFMPPGNIFSYEIGHARAPALLGKKRPKKTKLSSRRNKEEFVYKLYSCKSTE